MSRFTYIRVVYHIVRVHPHMYLQNPKRESNHDDAVVRNLSAYIPLSQRIITWLTGNLKGGDRSKKGWPGPPRLPSKAIVSVSIRSRVDNTISKLCVPKHLGKRADLSTSFRNFKLNPDLYVASSHGLITISHSYTSMLC